MPDRKRNKYTAEILVSSFRPRCWIKKLEPVCCKTKLKEQNSPKCCMGVATYQETRYGSQDRVPRWPSWSRINESWYGIIPNHQRHSHWLVGPSRRFRRVELICPSRLPEQILIGGLLLGRRAKSKMSPITKQSYTYPKSSKKKTTPEWFEHSLPKEMATSCSYRIAGHRVNHSAKVPYQITSIYWWVMKNCEKFSLYTSSNVRSTNHHHSTTDQDVVPTSSRTTNALYTQDRAFRKTKST